MISYCSKLFLTFIFVIVQQKSLISADKIKFVDSSSGLQEALNMAVGGDTIYLNASIFRGPLKASQSGTSESRITVSPAPDFQENIKLIGKGTNKAALSVTGNFWTFSKFTVSNRHALGVLISGDDNIIEDLVITGVAKAVMVKGNRNTLQECMITQAKMGVYLEGDYNVIKNDLIVGANPPIRVRKTTCCGTLQGNRFNGTIFMEGKRYNLLE